jgi:hypothetical protein
MCCSSTLALGGTLGIETRCTAECIHPQDQTQESQQSGTGPTRIENVSVRVVVDVCARIE